MPLSVIPANEPEFRKKELDSRFRGNDRTIKIILGLLHRGLLAMTMGFNISKQKLPVRGVFD